MGHDIDAYPVTESIAYLRRGAFADSEDKMAIYVLLGDKATDHYAGVSGDGAYEHFTADELQMALDIAIQERHEKDIIDFLTDALSVADERGVFIHFG